MTIKSSITMLLTLGLIATASLFASSPLHAQDADTMVVIDDDTSVDEVANVLALPENASAEGVENSAHGLETANAAREGGRDFGERRAADARSRAHDARDSAGESARDNARDRASDRARDAADSGDAAGDNGRRDR